MKNRWRLVAGALLLALVLAACGGDDDSGSGDTGTATGTTGGTTATTGTTGGGTVSPEEYVKSVCTSMSTWVTDVQNLSNDFGNDLDPTADIQTQKDAIVKLFDDMLSAPDTLISSLQAAGTPDVDNGDQIRTALSDSFDQARQALADAKDQIEGLSVDDPTAFAQQLTSIGSAIQTSMSGITGSLSGLQAPELEQAAANEPACSSLAAAGASGTT